MDQKLSVAKFAKILYGINREWANNSNVILTICEFKKEEKYTVEWTQYQVNQEKMSKEA